MKKLLKPILFVNLLFALMIIYAPLSAQTDSSSTLPPDAPNKAKGGATKFLLAGKATASWTNTISSMKNPDGTTTTTKAHNFFPEALMLMPLVKINKKLFLDAQVEVDPNFTGGGASIKLNELIIYYRLLPNLSVLFGNFSPKYGIFMGVLDDFTNRYATNPIGMVRGPQTQTGIGIQGGLQAGYSKFNYQLYLSNGPQHVIDTVNTGTANMTGQLNYGNYLDNNRNKAVGGSIGFLPFSNSSLQVDVSGQYTGRTGADGNHLDSLYPHSSTSWAVDLNYFHTFNPIMVRVLAEYDATMTQNYNYQHISTTDTVSGSPLIPSFNNKLSGWFVGATVRASGSHITFLSNLELGCRIGAYNPPKYTDAVTYPDAPWGQNAAKQTTICLTYWATWKMPLNIAYDVLTQTNQPTIKTIYTRFIFFF